MLSVYLENNDGKHVVILVRFDGPSTCYIQITCGNPGTKIDGQSTYLALSAGMNVKPVNVTVAFRSHAARKQT